MIQYFPSALRMSRLSISKCKFIAATVSLQQSLNFNAFNFAHAEFEPQSSLKLKILFVCFNNFSLQILVIILSYNICTVSYHLHIPALFNTLLQI